MDQATTIKLYDQNYKVYNFVGMGRLADLFFS